jgi:hypothetical protein
VDAAPDGIDAAQLINLTESSIDAQSMQSKSI